jgi:Zn-dependent peptidase ImmA (M78 family)
MRNRTNRWLKRVEKAVGESDREAGIQALVNRFRPVNESLETLAEQLGIERITFEPLPFDGGVYEQNGRRIIKINSLAPAIRQRFTLAHELGHLILERSVKGSASCEGDDGLERACNCVAVELLMPAEEARKIGNDVGQQSPEKLGPIANHFRVSLQTAAQRLHDLKVWNWGIGMWNCESVARQKWFVGVRPWRTDTPSLAAIGLALESRAPVCTTEYILHGERTEPVAVKAYHIGKKFVVAVVATARERKLESYVQHRP